jgi:uncharacterized protein (TIGR02594 family)
MVGECRARRFVPRSGARDAQPILWGVGDMAEGAVAAPPSTETRGKAMPNLPEAYRWIAGQTPQPRMIAEALALFDTREDLSRKSNPTILSWAAEVGGEVKEMYLADSTPWCGLFMAVVARRAGKTPPAKPLWALNWVRFGTEAGQPAYGDVMVFVRPGGGHVALYVGEDSQRYHVLGGNQGDKVCFAAIDKAHLRGARRPLYVNRPSTVRPVIVAAGGGGPVSLA